MTLEVFADISCPFAYVALQLVRELRDDRAPDTPIRVRAWPLELVNGGPIDVDETEEHVRELRGQLGLDYFKGFVPRQFPTTTLSALAVVAAAERAGRGEAAGFAVRTALWEGALDIGDESVVAELARDLGVTVSDDDRRSVLDDWHEGQERGVEGSPHFFCGDRSEFSPNLALTRGEDGSLVIERDPDRLEAFLQSCWS